MNSKLRQELFITALLGSLLLLMLVISPLLFVNWPDARQRLWQSLLVWALLWQQLWVNRYHNRSSGTAPLQTSLGWANRLTLVRGGLIAAIAGFLWLPARTGLAGFLPAICYTLAALGDRCDGALARRSGTTTVLGSRLDTSYDAIGLVIAPLLAIQYGKILPSYLLASAAYYLFVFGIRWRHHRNLPVLPLPPSALRRTLAGAQMGFVATALWPPIQPQLSQVTGVAFMLPLLLGFCIDWLVVSARLNIDSVNSACQQFAAHASQRLLPLLRLLLVAALWASWRPHDVAHTTALEAGIWLTGLGVVGGIAGRSCAMALLLLLNFYPGYDLASAAAVTTLFAAVGIIIFGTGRMSLWQRDGDVITRQDPA